MHLEKFKKKLFLVEKLFLTTLFMFNKNCPKIISGYLHLCYSCFAWVHSAILLAEYELMTCGICCKFIGIHILFTTFI